MALTALEDALVTGPTGTNVNDLFAIVIGGEPMSSEPMIVVERLVKEFGEVRAVNDVSLEIAAGEFFSMLGPSGCGKTTTLRVIAGFEEPDAGRVLLDGEDVTFVSPKKRNVNMVFQDYALFPHMTVAENVAFGLKLKRVDAARDPLAGRRDARPWSASTATRTAGRPSSPAASASASRSRGRSSTAPPRCCSTSRSERST